MVKLNLIGGVARYLNVSPNSGSLMTKLKEFVIKNNIDISHFTGQAWSQGRRCGYKYPIEDYFNNIRQINSVRLKQRLLEEGIKDHCCEKCLKEQWLDGLIPLELHHIDGNRFNNAFDNIMILCPNCHYIKEHGYKKYELLRA